MPRPLHTSVATLATLSVFLLSSSPECSAFVTAPASTAISPVRWSSSSTGQPSTLSTSYDGGSSGRGGVARRRRRSACASTSPEAAATEVAGGIEERRVDPSVTELPDSFEDSIVRMGRSTLQCMEEVCALSPGLPCDIDVGRAGTHAFQGRG